MVLLCRLHQTVHKLIFSQIIVRYYCTATRTRSLILKTLGMLGLCIIRVERLLPWKYAVEARHKAANDRVFGNKHSG
jgi:hypothetical protein